MKKVEQLIGSERNLQKVVYVYKTLPNNKAKKARVQLWGFKTNQSKKQHAKIEHYINNSGVKQPLYKNRENPKSHTSRK